MTKRKELLISDYDYVSLCSSINWDEMRDKTVFITGATGLIGKNIIHSLLYCNKKFKLNLKVIACVRNMEKARVEYSESIESGDNISFAVGDIRDCFDIKEKIDFIIHGASVTSSNDFVARPSLTIDTTVNGSRAVLDLAANKKVSSMVYLSTMEVYGVNKEEKRITENDIGYLDPMNVRSCYPESKKLCECMCAAYHSEFSVPVKVARLTQTFGPGVVYNDGRVFADFARCYIEGRDIVLHTAGETKRSYLYTADAVAAVLTILLSGKNGEAYHVANEDTYCSILEMANLVSAIESNKKIKVVIEIDDEVRGYAPTLKMNLDTSKIKRLGWYPSAGLKQMFIRTIEWMKCEDVK